MTTYLAGLCDWLSPTNRSPEIRPEAVASDVIYSVFVDPAIMDVRVKFGDSGSNRSRDM